MIAAFKTGNTPIELSSPQSRKNTEGPLRPPIVYKKEEATPKALPKPPGSVGRSRESAIELFSEDDGDRRLSCAPMEEGTPSPTSTEVVSVHSSPHSGAATDDSSGKKTMEIEETVAANPASPLTPRDLSSGKDAEPGDSADGGEQSSTPPSTISPHNTGDSHLAVSTTTSEDGNDGDGNNYEDSNDDDDDDDDKDLDRIATRAEEKDVMQQLLQCIEESENSRPAREHSSPSTSATSYSPSSKEVGKDGKSHVRIEGGNTAAWNVPPTMGPFGTPQLWASFRIRRRKMKTKSGSKARDIVEIERRKVRQRLPKWIPSESGRYSNEEDPSFLLFTRSEFVEKVYLIAEKRILGLEQEHHKFTCALSDEYLGDDSRPYLLEAEGSDEAMSILEETVENFIRETIDSVNLEFLLEDKASLMVDIKWPLHLDSDTSKHVLGVNFSTVEDTSTEGVYIHFVKRKGVLAKLLGGPEAYNSGCALLAVNDVKVSVPSDITDEIMRAKSECKWTESVTTIKLSLCLSKYSDLSQARNFSKLIIRRRDGLPYNEDDYATFRLDRFMNWTRHQPTKKTKKKAKPARADNKQAEDSTSSEDDLSSKRKKRERIEKQAKKSRQKMMKRARYQGEAEENRSSSDESFSVTQSVTVPKKRKMPSKVLGQKEVKRKKQVHRTESSSESDSGVDVSTFAIMDTSSDDEVVTQKPSRKKTSGSNNNTSGSNKNHFSGYTVFRHMEKKLNPLLSLDFKDTGINIKRISSSVWKEHKRLLGENAVCGDDCKCLMWLPEMTKNVLKDHIAVQKKKFIPKGIPVETEAELEKRTCGISKHFVSRFIVLLQEEYPEENETQLVKRLVGMWEEHQRNRLYGLKCGEDCGCRCEWDQLFGKGDKAKAREFMMMMKRSHILSKNKGSSNKQSGVATGPAVPRKNSSQSLIPMKRSKVRTNSFTNKPKLSGLISSMSSRVDYFDVEVSSSQPIGAHFKTKGKQCEVVSVYQKGQLAKYPRIANGTVVKSVKYSGTHVAVSTHKELHNCYDRAKRLRKKMVITFDNKGLKISSAQANNINNSSWSPEGQWIGAGITNLDEAEYGWAGGSPIVLPSETAKKTTPQNKAKTNNVTSILNKIKPGVGTGSKQNTGTNTSKGSHKNRQNLPAETRRDSAITVDKAQPSGPLEEWQSIVNIGNPGQNSVAPTSILLKHSSFLAETPEAEKGLSKLIPMAMKKAKRARTHSRKVTFSMPKNEEFFFRKDEPPNVQSVLTRPKSTTAQTSKNNFSEHLSVEQLLVNAFREKSCNDVIDVLESEEFAEALSSESFELEPVLQREYNAVSDELNRVAEENKQLKDDLSAKKTILKIYINCIHLIGKTLSLKKWYSLKIELKYIDLQQNYSIVDAFTGSVQMRFQDGSVTQDLGSLPIKNMARHISYNDGGEKLEFTVSNNKCLPYENRDFVVELQRGSLQHPAIIGRSLGLFTLELDNIEEKCPIDGNPTEISEQLSGNSTQEIADGHITIKASKQKADKEYVRQKKQEILRKFRNQLDFIQRFNQDPATPPGAKLSANISGIGGKSILFAAVILMIDTDLVERMLKLGADPRIGTRDTPLSVAQRNYHSALEKEKNLRRQENKNLNIDIEPQVKHCNQARLIVELLQKNVIGIPPAIAEAPPPTIAEPSPPAIAETPPPAIAEPSPPAIAEAPPPAIEEAPNPSKTSVEELADKVLQLTNQVPISQGTFASQYPPMVAGNSQVPLSQGTFPPQYPPMAPGNNQAPYSQGIYPPPYSSQSPISQGTLAPQYPPMAAGNNQMQIHQATLRQLRPPPPPPPPPIPPPPPNPFAPTKAARIDKDDKQFELTPLPVHKIRAWVVNKPGITCTTKKCRFCKKRVCRYWQDETSPLPQDLLPPMPHDYLPSEDELPNLHEKSLKTLKKHIKNATWWTAAYLYKPAKTVVYVRKILASAGRVSDNGIVWFNTKSAALNSLRMSVFYFKKTLGTENDEHLESNRKQTSQHRKKESSHYGPDSYHEPRHEYHYNNYNQYPPPKTGYNPTHRHND